MDRSRTNQSVTTVQIGRDLHRRLKDIRPYNSMSFHELIEDMADTYEKEQGGGPK